MKQLISLSILLLCFASPTAFAGQWGSLVWGSDKWGEDTGTMPINPLPDLNFEDGYGFDAKIAFYSEYDVYNAGEYFVVDLYESVATDAGAGLDLWIAVEVPSGSLLFLSPNPFSPFSPMPQPFRQGVENANGSYRVLEFVVPPGLQGMYTFYAVYMEGGRDPMVDGFTFQRSSLAFKQVMLQN